MSSRITLLCCLCLTLAALPVLAAPPLASAGPSIDDALPAGWVAIDDGVLQKQGEDGRLHTVTYGAAGQNWLIHQLETELGRMLLDRELGATTELDAAIADHRALIAQEKELLRQGDLGNDSAALQAIKAAPSCDVSFGYDADASPGANADASSYFEALGSNCPTGEVYAYAYCRKTIGGTQTTSSQADGPRSGFLVSAGASCSFDQSYENRCDIFCYSYARAYVRLSGVLYQTTDSNNDCLGLIPC